MSGELAKLKIEAYSDKDFSKRVGVYQAQVNPEKVSFKYQIELEEQQAKGDSAAQPRYGKTKPEEMTFQFLFDSTGAIPLAGGHSSISADGVTTRIDAFKAVVLDFNGTEHKPNNLKLIWGKILFKCVLKDLSLEYQVFASDGTPIRATASAKFIGYVEDSLRLAEERRQSPDLTHARVVKDGETLQDLVMTIYGDPALYLEVAQANGLTNFRNLKTGQTLFFPPIEANRDGDL